MFKKMNDRAQGSSLLLLLIMFFIIMFVFGNPAVQAAFINFGNAVFSPIIGFGGKYPVLTVFCAGLIVVLLSSLLTNFFTDWKKMGESQEVSRAFQKEITKARKEGNTNRVNKLMKMQPEIMKRQTEASGGMMKPMFFLIIFIYPIFIWLRIFLLNLPHYYITVPWANQVSLFSWPFGFGQAWLWLYLIFSMVMGQLLRQGFKYISWTDRWKEFRERIRPTSIR